MKLLNKLSELLIFNKYLQNLYNLKNSTINISFIIKSKSTKKI